MKILRSYPQLSGLSVKSLRKQYPANGELVSLIALCLAIVLFVTAFCIQAFGLYNRFAYMNFDLAIFDQATWLISRGRPAFVTVRGLHILADHFSVILYLLAPLYWIAPTPKTLLFIQTVALGLGALPVYAFARKLTNSAYIGLCFAFVYLCYPAMQWSATYEFHPDTLATPLLLACINYAYRKHWWQFALCLTGVALTKETAGLTILFLGISLCLWLPTVKESHRIQNKVSADHLAGLLTMAFGLLMLAVSLATVRFFNQAPSPYFYLFEHWGKNPVSLVTALGKQPLTLGHIIVEHKEYFTKLLAPTFFLALFAPRLLLAGLPAVAANLLSNRYGMHTIEEQYTALLSPFILAASIVGYARISRAVKPPVPHVLLVVVCVWSIGTMISWGPLGSDHSRLYTRIKTEDARAMRSLFDVIPENASVSAQMALGAQMSGRPEIYHFPNPFSQNVWGGTRQALMEIAVVTGAQLSSDFAENVRCAPVEYVVLCPASLRFPFGFETYLQAVITLLQSPSYGIVAVNKDAIVLKRGANHAGGLQMLASKANTHSQKPEVLLWAWLGERGNIDY